MLAFVWWVGSMDIHRYFDLQMSARGTWLEMSAPQAQTARLEARYGDTHDIYVDPWASRN